MYNGECTILIKDIKPGLKNINVIFIVLEIGTATVTKENREVRNFKVGDHTACINVSIWDEPGKLIAPGDIIKLTKGYASIWRHCLTLYSGKNGEVYKIGEFCMTFNEQINMSEPKRPEPPQQTPQALGMVVNPNQIMPTPGGGGNASIGGNNGTPVTQQQLPTAAGNGGVPGNNTTGSQRLVNAQIGQTGAGGNKAANMQQVGAGSKANAQGASGSGQATPAASGAGAGTQQPAPKTSRGGRANNTRSSNLKNERR